MTTSRLLQTYAVSLLAFLVLDFTILLAIAWALVDKAREDRR